VADSEALVDLLLGILVLPLEGGLSEVAEHDQALGTLRRNARQALAVKERAQHARLLRPGPRGSVDGWLGTRLLVRQPAQGSSDLGQAVQTERVVHVRTPWHCLDEARLTQPVQMVHDGARAKRQAACQLLDRYRLALGEQTDDAQPGCVRKRLHGHKQFRVNHSVQGNLWFDLRQIAVAPYDRPVKEARPLGPHLPLAQGLLKAAARAEEIGATAVQVFTDNPTAWRRRSEQPEDLAVFRKRLKGSGVQSIAVHAPYLVNLCGSDDDFWHKSVSTMANELSVGSTYGADFVVMHIGSHRGTDRERGIARLIEGLGAVLRQVSEPLAGDHLPRLVLENSAGTGDGIGSTLEDLADIADAAAAAGLPEEHIGFCLDTAHLWGAGYDISNAAGVEDVSERVAELLGRDRVVMLHLNDSRTTVGSHLDRHEHIGAGQLGTTGMREVLTHPWLATLPTFLETPGMDVGYDQVNLERARQLFDGLTPEALPPEAFLTRSSKARTAPPGP